MELKHVNKLNIRTAAKRENIFRDIKSNPFSYLLLTPSLLYVFIFGYLTMPYMLIAFQRYNFKLGLLGSQWVGLQNFKFLTIGNTALNVTITTLKLNLLFIVFDTLFALFFAIVFNEVRSRLFVRVTQSMFIFPHFLSWVIVSYIVYSFFSSEYGIVNKLIASIGIDPVNWYSNAEPWTAILVVLRTWKDTGLKTVIYLASITAIDNTLYEASYIDGANRWQKIVHITIPLLMPTVIILTLLAVGKIFYGDFGMIYAIIRDNGILYPTTDVIDTYVFRSFRMLGDPSQAMAVGFLQSFIGFILVFGTNWITKRAYPDGAIY